MAVRVYGGASTVGGGSANDPVYIVGTVGFVRGGGGATIDSSGNATDRNDGVFDVTGYTSNDDLAEARTQRDAWFNTHAEILEEYRTGPALIIELVYNVSGTETVTYERYRQSTSSWVDIAGIIEGRQGDQGYQGVYEIRVYQNITDTSSLPSVPNDGTYNPTTKTWTTEPTGWSATPTQPGNDEVTIAAYGLIDPADSAQQSAFTPTFDFVAQFSSHFLTPHEMAEAVSNDILLSGTGVPDDADADDELSQLYFRIRTGQVTEIYRSAIGASTWTQTTFGSGGGGGGIDNIAFYTFYKRNFQLPDTTTAYNTSGTIGTDAHVEPNATTYWYDTVASADSARPNHANEPLWAVDIIDIDYATEVVVSDAKPIGHNPHSIYRGMQELTDVDMDLIPEEEEIDGDESFLIEGNTDLLELLDTTGNRISLRPTGTISEFTCELDVLQTPFVVRYHNPGSDQQERDGFVINLYVNSTLIGNIFANDTVVTLGAGQSGTVHYSSGEAARTVTQDLTDADTIHLVWESENRSGTDVEYTVQYEGEPVEISFEITGTHPGGAALSTDTDGDIVAVEANGDENKLFTRGGRFVGEGERDIERKIEEALAETLQLDADSFLIWTRSASAPTAATGTYDLNTKEYTLPSDWQHHIDDLTGDDELYFNTIRITKSGQTVTGIDAGTPRTLASGAGIVPYVDGEAFDEGRYVRADGLEYYVLQDDDGTNGPPADNPTYYDPLRSVAVRALHTPHDGVDNSAVSMDYDSAFTSADNDGVLAGEGTLTFTDTEAENSFSYDADTGVWTVDEDIDTMTLRNASGTIPNSGYSFTLYNGTGSGIEIDRMGIRIIKNRGESDESSHDVIRRSENFTVNAGTQGSFAISTGTDNQTRIGATINLTAGDTIELEAFATTVNSADQTNIGLRRVTIAAITLRLDTTYDEWAVDFEYDESTRQFGIQNENRDTHGLFNTAGQATGTLKQWADERDYIPLAFYVDSDSPDEQYDVSDFTWNTTDDDWDTPTGVVADRPGTISDELHVVILFHTNEDEPVARYVMPTLPDSVDGVATTVEEEFSENGTSGWHSTRNDDDDLYFRIVINGHASRAIRLPDIPVDEAFTLTSEDIDTAHDTAYSTWSHYEHWSEGQRWHSLPPNVSVRSDGDIECHADNVEIEFEPIVNGRHYLLITNLGSSSHTQTETLLRFERRSSGGSLLAAINVAEQTEDNVTVGSRGTTTLDMEESSGDRRITLNEGERGRFVIVSTPDLEGINRDIRIEGGVLRVNVDMDIEGPGYELDIDTDYLTYRDGNVPDSHPNNARQIMDFETGRMLIVTTPPRLIYGGYNRDSRRGPRHTLNANGKVTWDPDILEDHFGGDESIVTFLETAALPPYLDDTPGATSTTQANNQAFQISPNTYDIEIRGSVRSHGTSENMYAYLRRVIFGDFDLTTHIYEDFAYVGAGNRFLAIANSNDEIRGWTDEGERHTAYDINIATAGDQWRAVCYSAERDLIFAIAREDDSSNADMQARAWELDGTRQTTDDSGDISADIDDPRAMDAIGTRFVVLSTSGQTGALRIFRSNWDRISSLDVTLPNLTGTDTYEGVCYASDGDGYWVLSTDKLEYFGLDGTEDGDREIDLSGITDFDPAGVTLDTSKDRLFILNDNSNTALAYDEADGRRRAGDEILDEAYITTGGNLANFELIAKSLEFSGDDAILYVDFGSYNTTNRPEIGHYMLIENLTA